MDTITMKTLKTKIQDRINTLRTEEKKAEDPRIAYALDVAIRELQDVQCLIDDVFESKQPDLRQCLHNLTKMCRDGDVTSEVLQECDRALKVN